VSAAIDLLPEWQSDILETMTTRQQQQLVDAPEKKQLQAVGFAVSRMSLSQTVSAADEPADEPASKPVSSQQADAHVTSSVTSTSTSEFV
jgi:hypothetical protein